MFGGNYAPNGWEFCNGQLLAIADNDALFALIGTNYGGDGQNTFALPDLRGRVPLHQGNTFLGEQAGEENHTLTAGELPAHTHTLGSATAASALSPAQAAPAVAAQKVYGASTSTPMAPSIIGNSGGGQPHTNLQPFLAVSFIIALFGVFPPRN